MPETTETIKVVESPKPSKLERVKSVAVTVAWIAIPTALTGGMMYASLKMSKMQLDTAKLNLEAAKLNKA
jgi:hypothetical protein